MEIRISSDDTRYLHLNTLCLENTVTMYCANAKKLFRRLNFRLRSPSAQEPTPSSPFLKGGVVIKKIHSWNDVNPSVEYGPYDDDDINDDNAVDMDVVVPVESAAKHPSRNTSIVHDSAKEAADRETLVLIYSLLLAISVFTLMCILICFVWCRKTGHATITKPLY
ncbi:hypothetical protein TELCIR_14828 [Teladorsagia circumcincta]|uniref:Uncharacterized protein n=1 Tax=Teladorsagia circumcincta TaxID=45464 RepID=A0A2G9U069_TELCI|nr:hypothetical protein TELCIR_14828 [Teladorsagia circumcincta]